MYRQLRRKFHQSDAQEIRESGYCENDTDRSKFKGPFFNITTADILTTYLIQFVQNKSRCNKYKSVSLDFRRRLMLFWQVERRGCKINFSLTSHLLTLEPNSVIEERHLTSRLISPAFIHSVPQNNQTLYRVSNISQKRNMTMRITATVWAVDQLRFLSSH